MRKVLSQWLDLIQWELIHPLDLKGIQWLVLMRPLEELWIKLWTKALVGVPPIQERHQTRAQKLQ